jgi:hypothetical protein
MPVYRDPFQKGILYVKFDVKFPENNTFDEETIKKLEVLLPPKPKVDIPTGENVEEVSMVEYSQTRGGNNARSSSHGHGHGHAAHSGFFGGSGVGGDDSDGEEGGPQRVECNTH